MTSSLVDSPKPSRRRLAVLALPALLAAGCVSSSKHKDLQSQRDQLDTSLQQANAKLQDQSSQLDEQKNWIRELESKLGKNTSDRAALEANLNETRKALEESKQRRLEAEKRIAEYTDLVRRFKSLVDAGRLSVKIVDGRMVVALSSDVLFPSGSARLSKEGESAIREVAKLLVTIPNRKYQVEGHTDNVPIRTPQFPSNWELASARALGVVRAMMEAGMPPERVSAASFGDTKPAKANDTTEGKSSNRRIEIVIAPDLSSLPGFEQLERLGKGGA